MIDFTCVRLIARTSEDFNRYYLGTNDVDGLLDRLRPLPEEFSFEQVPNDHEDIQNVSLAAMGFNGVVLVREPYYVVDHPREFFSNSIDGFFAKLKRDESCSSS